MIYTSDNCEVKYIIVKDKAGHLRHYKSEYDHHETIARNNGYNSSDIIEAGLFLEGYLYILEGISQEHLKRRAEHYIGNRLNFYQDLRLEAWLKGRELETQLYYSKKPIGILKEGD
jgi:uncharacterized protein YegP (UPF0339 family)